MKNSWTTIIATGGGGAMVMLGGMVAGNAMQTWWSGPRQVNPSKFSTLAGTYDAKIHKTEEKLGIVELRKKMATMARGRVLEVAAGTCRNAAYYDAKTVTSVCITDVSPEMLTQAKTKVDMFQEPLRPHVSFRVLDANNLTTLLKDDEDKKFDTVIDTFGLCSVHDPILVLQEMASVLDPQAGKLLLLEHGRVSHDKWYAWFLNLWIDFLTPEHARQWGCLHNRPIIDLVKEAGLEIESIEEAGWGTISLVKATRPSR